MALYFIYTFLFIAIENASFGAFFHYFFFVFNLFCIWSQQGFMFNFFIFHQCIKNTWENVSSAYTQSSKNNWIKSKCSHNKFNIKKIFKSWNLSLFEGSINVVKMPRSPKGYNRHHLLQRPHWWIWHWRRELWWEGCNKQV